MREREREIEREREREKKKERETFAPWLDLRAIKATLLNQKSVRARRQQQLHTSSCRARRRSLLLRCMGSRVAVQTAG